MKHFLLISNLYERLFQICKHGNGRPGGHGACFILLLSTSCAEIEIQDLLVQIFMDLARAGRMLGMALILVLSCFLTCVFVVCYSTPQDTSNNHKAFAENMGVRIKTHNIVTHTVLYS